MADSVGEKRVCKWRVNLVLIWSAVVDGEFSSSNDLAKMLKRTNIRLGVSLGFHNITTKEYKWILIVFRFFFFTSKLKFTSDPCRFHI